MGDKVRVSHRNLLSRKLKAIISQNRLMKILKELKNKASVYKVSVSKRRKAKLLSRKKNSRCEKDITKKTQAEHGDKIEEKFGSRKQENTK